MAELVPAEFQDKLNAAGFEYIEGEAVVRTEMGVGQDKVRNRYTTSIDAIRGSIDINKDQITSWKTFFKTTLANGSKTFLFKDPFSLVDTEFQFKGQYSLRPKGGKVFSITFVWEYVP